MVSNEGNKLREQLVETILVHPEQLPFLRLRHVDGAQTLVKITGRIPRQHMEIHPFARRFVGDFGHSQEQLFTNAGPSVGRLDVQVLEQDGLAEPRGIG